MINPFTQIEFNKIFKMKNSESNQLKTRESTTIEFKQAFSWSNKSLYGKTMSAYANREGGYIIFGIKDSPREIIGLQSDNFEKTDEEKITNYLNETFSPEINWEKTTVEVVGKTLGVIYVYQAKHKPIISKKNDGDIKEAEIYYRYRGRSEKIKYPELSRLINNELDKVNKLWIRQISTISKTGINNIALLDTINGKIEGQGGTLLIDENLLDEIAFIKEGQFTEVEGAKTTLKLIGNVSTIDGSSILPTRTKYINLGRREMYESLLMGKLHQNTSASEYIEHLIDESSKDVPIYIYKALGGLTDEDIINILQNTQTTKISHRNRLIARIRDNSSFNKYRKYRVIDANVLNDKLIFTELDSFNEYLENKVNSISVASALLYNLITINGIDSVTPFIEDYAKEILIAITYLDKDFLTLDMELITTLLMEIYDNQYSKVAPEFRAATCFIDSELYKHEEQLLASNAF